MREFEQKKPANNSYSPFFGPKVQKKLTTGTVGDKYEKEADNVADKVVNKRKTGGLLQSRSEEAVQQKPISETISTVQKQDLAQEQPLQKKGKEKEEDKKVQKKSDKEEDKKVQKKGEKEEDKKVQKKSDKEEDKKVQKKGEKEDDKKVQKKCADCEAEDKKAQKKEEIQAKFNESNSVNEGVESDLNGSKGSGNGMDKNTKQEMESGFEADFSNVNIHTDSKAVQMSEELGAQAFTHGNDVYFNKGKYNPDSREGKHLLAHELTHTIQQTGGKSKSGTIQKTSIENHSEDLQAERPQNPQFRGNPPLEKANDNQMLISTGQKGQYVSELQQGLMKAGQSLPKFGADEDFGTETRNAVIGFQTENSLNKIDGLVGPETIGALDNVLVAEKGGKKDGCKSTVNFNKGPFQSEASAGFFSTAKCPNVTITIDAVAQIVEFHNCSTLEISIDHVGRTKRTIKIDNNGKGHFEETFTMKNHDDIHKLFFTMPEQCKGMGDTFTVSGSIKRH